MGIMRVMDREGDSVTEWDADSEADVERAREIFDRAMGERRQAYRVDSPEGGAVIRHFEPDAKEIILAAPLVGG